MYVIPSKKNFPRVFPVPNSVPGHEEYGTSWTLTHLQCLTVWMELPQCYFLWTYPVRWAGHIDRIPILRMEKLSLGDLCEEMETREFESLFQGHTASKCLSLNSDPEEGCLTPPSCLFKEHCVRFFSTQRYVMFFSP